jgi:hypothetical protein
MLTKKNRPVRRTAKKRAGRKRAATKRLAPKKRTSVARRRPSVGKKRASAGTTVRRKEREVEETRHRSIDAKNDLAVEQLAKRVHPATRKRGADPYVPSKTRRKHSSNSKEQKLEQGLEESMAGSDPVSVTHPGPPASDDDS